MESTCACVLGLEHSCPWPRECLSSERLSLALDFFCVLGLEPCVLDSTSAHNLTDGIDIEVVNSDTGSDATRSTTSETATSDACNSKDGTYIIDTDGDATRPTVSGVSDAIKFSISNGISINLEDETTSSCNDNEPVTCHANTSLTTGAVMSTNLSNDPGSWQKLTQNEINELIRCGPPNVPNGFVYPTDP